MFRTLRRDKRSLGLILVGPLLAVLAFGFVFGTELTNVEVVVVQQDQGPLGERFVAELDRDLLDIVREDSAQSAFDEVENGDAWAAIVIPSGFSASLAGNGTAKIDVRVDGSNAQVVSALTQELRRSLEEASGGVQQREVPIQTTFVYAEGAKYIDFFVPGIMSFAVFLFTTLLTLLAFVGERANGMLQRLQTSPIRDTEIVLGQAIAYGTVAAVQAAVLFVAAILLFDITVAGPFWVAILILVLLGMTSQALGIFLSAAAKREAQAVQMFPIIVFPTLVLSGLFLPVESLPEWVRPLSYAVPPTWATEAMRSILLRGWGMEDVWLHFLALAGFAVLFLALAVFVLRRQRR